MIFQHPQFKNLPQKVSPVLLITKIYLFLVVQSKMAGFFVFHFFIISFILIDLRILIKILKIKEGRRELFVNSIL